VRDDFEAQRWWTNMNTLSFCFGEISRPWLEEGWLLVTQPLLLCKGGGRKRGHGMWPLHISETGRNPHITPIEAFEKRRKWKNMILPSRLFG
jgi:hypothetical protein